LSSKLVEKDL
jgi:uncharacterized coiled-coil protein SlyX